MQRFPVIARTLQDLQAKANPPSGSGMMEVVPAFFYDSETYIDNTTTTLRFFATTKQNVSLSNMEAAGQFPAPQFFEPWYFYLDTLVPPVAARLTAWADTWALVFGDGTTAGTPYFQFSMSGKSYAIAPLSTLHGTGGLPGSFGYGTTTADSIAEQASNAAVIPGWCWEDSLLIPPTVGFQFVITWPVAVNITANRQLRVGMSGPHYRRIL